MKKERKRWTNDECQMLDDIGRNYGRHGCIAINRVPIDRWPPNRTIGASCYQMNQSGWRTTGIPMEGRLMLPADWFNQQNDESGIFTPLMSPPTVETHSFFWGLYTKTIQR